MNLIFDKIIITHSYDNKQALAKVREWVRERYTAQSYTFDVIKRHETRRRGVFVITIRCTLTA